MTGQAIKQTLGKNIKLIRARRGLSQAALAEKAGISITFLSNIERGLKYPLPNILSKIANTLDIEVNQLFVAHTSSNEGKKLLKNMSDDFTQSVIATMEKISKRYLK
jgi:transcriptional regulator with XRE-family HTH domain